MMLTEEQKRRIVALVQKFREEVSSYLQKKSELDKCKKIIQEKTMELSKVAEEERQIETAMEILYGEEKKESRARKIEEEIKLWREKSEKLRNELIQLKTNLLRQMRDLPIPADLENLKHEESYIVFPFFEEAKLGNEGINVICDLFEEKPPLKLNDVLILPDKIIAKNASKKQEAIFKLVEAIRSFRLRVDDLLKSYEHIDEIVERVKRSKRYTEILKVLAKKEKLSTEEIASFLNVDKRKAYDACYNLTRSNWSPTPIRRTSSGEWELTLAGKILVKRLLERFPQEKAEIILE